MAGMSGSESGSAVVASSQHGYKEGAVGGGKKCYNCTVYAINNLPCSTFS